MICSITGEKALEPVVSPKSGAIFEKKHIINYITTSGTDPITDEPLTVEELVAITQPVSNIIPPNPTSATSIPALLSTFQNEWDSLALEVFTLRKQLHKARQELSSALYHHDAAIRVAANAIRERDEVKKALETLATTLTDDSNIVSDLKTSPTDQLVDQLVDKLDDKVAVAAAITSARESLYQLHKSTKTTLSLGPQQTITFSAPTTKTHPFKKVTSKHFTAPTLLIASSTGSVAKYDFSNGNIAKFTASKGTITSMNYVAYNDTPLPILAYKEKLVLGENEHSLPNTHNDIISQILVHPKLTNLFVTLGGEEWKLNDTSLENVLYTISVGEPVTSGAIHVDGALLAIGTKSGKVHIYNLTDGQKVSTLETQFPKVAKMEFALNGYWLLVGSETEDTSTIEIFDLRKNSLVHTIPFESRPVDFFIDPSSSLIFTADSKTLSVHRYFKKGKKFENNVAKVDLEEEMVSIEMLCDAEGIVKDGDIKVVGVGKDSKVMEYEVGFGEM
jgi:pre-mRNA-processing factor 19